MAKQAKATKSTGGDNFTRWLVIGMVTLVVATGAIFSVISQKSKANESFAALDGFKPTSAIASTIDPVNGTSITFNTGAKTTVDLWEDPQCPICNSFEKANGAYIDDLILSKKANVSFHVLSFLGDESIRTANALYCAADEGRYLDLHNALYLVQPDLENSGFFSSTNILKIAAKINLDSASFITCVNKGTKINEVKAALDSMPKYNVKGTPTVFINGKLWERKNPTFLLSEFRTAVEAG